MQNRATVRENAPTSAQADFAEHVESLRQDFNPSSSIESGHEQALSRQRDLQELHTARGRETRSEIGLHTLRHTYRTLLDESGAPMKVQQELMRRVNIQTTMNVYGSAMLESKRTANSKIVRMLLVPLARAKGKGRAPTAS